MLKPANDWFPRLLKIWLKFFARQRLSTVVVSIANNIKHILQTLLDEWEKCKNLQKKKHRKKFSSENIRVFIVKGMTSKQKKVLINTHTHTHTHTYIYIYIYDDRAGEKLTVTINRSLCHRYPKIYLLYRRYWALYIHKYSKQQYIYIYIYIYNDRVNR